MSTQSTVWPASATKECLMGCAAGLTALEEASSFVSSALFCSRTRGVCMDALTLTALGRGGVSWPGGGRGGSADAPGVTAVIPKPSKSAGASASEEERVILFLDLICCLHTLGSNC